MHLRVNGGGGGGGGEGGALLLGGTEDVRAGHLLFCIYGLAMLKTKMQPRVHCCRRKSRMRERVNLLRIPINDILGGLGGEEGGEIERACEETGVCVCVAGREST